MKRLILSINIPNILTIVRILLTPLFVIFLLKNWPGYALMVFAVAGVSDALDGLLARYFNQRTVLGAYLDPIADKMLLLSAFITLAVMHVVPSWLTVIVISRDVVIVIGVVVMALFNIRLEIKPSMISKCTTAFQLITIFFALLKLKIATLQVVTPMMFWITAALTISSGLHYIFTGLIILQKGDEEQAKRG